MEETVDNIRRLYHTSDIVSDIVRVSDRYTDYGEAILLH